MANENTKRSVNLQEYIESLAYLKTQTYNRQEVETEIEKFNVFEIVTGSVSSIPVNTIKKNKIYLELNNLNLEKNRYNFYIYRDNQWEQIDSLEFSIDNYYSKGEVDNIINTHGHLVVSTQEGNQYNGFMSVEDKLKLDTIEPSILNPKDVSLTGNSIGTSTHYSREDHIHKHPIGHSKTGNPTANQTPSFGDSFTVTQFTSNATGHISGSTDRTITIPNTLSNTASTVKNVVVTDNTDKLSVVSTLDGGKITDETITTSKIKNGTLLNEDLSDATIETGKIKDSAITTSKIKDSAVTTAKLGTGAVTNDKIEYDTIETDKIKDEAITNDKIATNTITLSKLDAEDMVDTTIGGTNGSSKLITSDAVKKHIHGNLQNDGSVKVSNTLQKNKNIVTDSNGYLNVEDKTTDKITDTTAYTNIGTSANATQKTINEKVNTAIGLKANSSDVYPKSETMTSTEINTAIIDGVSNINLFEVVSSLPTTNIKGNKFYLTRNTTNLDKNLYDINIYVNNKWEQIDSLEFNISDYIKKTSNNTNIVLADGNNISQSTFATKNHKSTTTDYGVGDSSNYGHLKLDTSINANGSNPVSGGAIKSYVDNKFNGIVEGTVDLSAISNAHNHDTRYIKVSTEITTESPLDLNDTYYKNQGLYNCPLTATAKLMSNTPWGNQSNNAVAFSLTVLKTTANGVKQILYPYFATDNTVYIRGMYNNSWGDWSTVSLEGHNHILSDITNGAECVWSTHASGTNNWTGVCSHLKSISKGTVIYFSLRQVPTTDNAVLQLKLADGTYFPSSTTYSRIYFAGGYLKNQFPQYSLIGLVYDGNNWVTISNYTDTNTTYTADNNTLQLSSNQFSVKDTGITYAKLNTDVYDTTVGGTSGSTKLITSNAVYQGLNKKQNIQDNFCGNIDATHWYLKPISFEIKGNYVDRPITFRLDSRRPNPIYVTIIFRNEGNTDPQVATFETTGGDNTCYLYKESTSKWSLIVRKSELYDGLAINQLVNNNSNITITYPNESLETLPTSNILQSRYVTENINPNLLDNTREFTDVGLENNVASTVASYTYKGCTVRYLSGGQSQNVGFYWTIPSEKLKLGGIYTLSFWARADSSHQSLITYFYQGVNARRIKSNTSVFQSIESDYGDGATQFSLTMGWRRYYVVYQLNSTGTMADKRLLLRLTTTATASSQNLVVCGVKFEEGNHATDYCGSGNDAKISKHSQILIPSNASLNDYTEPGWYNNRSNASVQSITNTPWTEADNVSGSLAFTMEVLYTYGVIQILYPYTGDDVWIRRSRSPTANWTAWRKIYNNANLTKANITALGIPSQDTTYSKGDGLLLSGTTFSADFGTGNKQVARGDHNHSGTYVDTVGTKNTTNGSAIAEIKANTTVKGTVYHPKVLSSAVSSGLYKIAVNTDGHITGTTSVGASDLPSHTHAYLPSNANGTTTGHLTQANGYVSTSGGTGNIPISEYLTTTDSTTTYLPKIKSFIGGIKFDGNGGYKNIISARYRNGSGDGDKYGLYLSSNMTAEGNLIWNKQRNVDGTGVWQGERTILDNSNTSYTQTQANGTGGYTIGTIKVNDTSTTIYGKDTVYTHPSSHPSTFISNGTAYGYIKSGETSSNVTLTTQKLINDNINSTLGNKLNKNADDTSSGYITAKGFKVSNKSNFLKADGTTADANYYVHPASQQCTHTHDWNSIHQWDVVEATLPDNAIFLVNRHLRLCQYIDWGERRFNTTVETIGQIPSEFTPRNGSRVSQIANIGNAFQYNPIIFIDYDGKIGTIATSDRGTSKYQVRVSLFWSYLA